MRSQQINRMLLRLLVIIVSILSIHKNYGQGPNAPEAASFEPVDATDMVSLITGDFTYVLPLLNVPSPEGGYPIALSYHAGIAMDQEASWTGLGWNLNPGAINRGVNGYPDDYNKSTLEEYFYDEGGRGHVYDIYMGYSAYGAWSVGNGFSWGSNKSLSGYVSAGYGYDLGGGNQIGVGITIGPDRQSMNVGFTSSSGLSVGINMNGEKASASVGFNTNGIGYSINSDGMSMFSLSIGPVGVDFSSTGIHTNALGMGSGVATSFNNTVKEGDYIWNFSSSFTPIAIPTVYGIFSFSFGKQEYRYYLANKEKNPVNGPFYFNGDLTNTQDLSYIWTCGWLYEYIVEYRHIDDFTDPSVGLSPNGRPYVSFTPLDFQEIGQDSEGNIWGYRTFSGKYHDIHVTLDNNAPSNGCELLETKNISLNQSFMDVYEVPLDEYEISDYLSLDSNNMVLPNYDVYNVQAQGLSGGMSPKLFENGNLFGLATKENRKGYSLGYSLNGGSTNIPLHTKFDGKPYFYMDNELSTYLEVSEANFNTTNTNSSILDYYADDNSVEVNPELRRLTSNFIEYYTVKEIRENYNLLKTQGYLKPGSGFDVNVTHLPKDGIAAFKVTAVDGKTYHYSLPVYNQEMVSRTFGTIEARPLEAQSYTEKRQLEPYATHWLLTAVTGPDYIDINNNGIADKGDYGYWTAFEYGKWSDAFAWKGPYGEDYLETKYRSSVFGAPPYTSKTWFKGRKEVYYLDRIKTRTHTALFIKNTREDGLSPEWEYSSVNHIQGFDQTSSSYTNRFTIPSQKPLRLEKIILIKEEDDVLNKAYGVSSEAVVNVVFNDSEKPSEQAWYHLKDNVIDTGDNWQGLIAKAEKVIDLNYDYSLAKGCPNTSSSNFGRLTLNSVTFKGRAGEQLIPPYSFDYHNEVDSEPYDFDYEDRDAWGYMKLSNKIWSLKSINTPTGGQILPQYKTHYFNEVLERKVKAYRERGFDTYGYIEEPDWLNVLFYDESLGPNDKRIRIYLRYKEQVNEYSTPVAVGDKFHVEFQADNSSSQPLAPHNATCEYNGLGTVTQVHLPGTLFATLTYEILLDGSLQSVSPYECSSFTVTQAYKIRLEQEQVNPNAYFWGGGIRTQKIITTDGNGNSYHTDYKYGENENGLGYVSYVPKTKESNEELPYSTELPAPKVMYEHVAIENATGERVEYKFNILKEQDPSGIKFGDFYEIETEVIDEHYNAIADKNVEIKKYTIKDNLAAIGQLLSVSTFNSNGQLLSQLENNYFSSQEIPDQIGITKESYQSYKIVDYFNNNITKDKWLVNNSSRIKYPTLVKSSKEIKDNFELETTFGAFDPITGVATETYTTASDGTSIMTKTFPAYTFSDYNPQVGYGMGSKVEDITNKNMLSQTAAQYSYIKDPISNQWNITSVGITTWNNLWRYPNSTEANLEVPLFSNEKIWRKHKTYVWDGELDSNGAYEDFGVDHDNFNWSLGQISYDNGYAQWVDAPQTNPKWKDISTITLYDHFSKPLEIKDVNGNYASTKMTDKNSKTLLTSSARFFESFYTGGENYDTVNNRFEAQIRGDQGLITDLFAHTGSHAIAISPSDNTFGAVLRRYFHRKGDYKISVWVHKDNYQNARVKETYGGSLEPFNGEKVFAGDWVQLNHYFEKTEDISDRIYMIASVSGTIYIDDFRMHPIESSMNSYVYNEWDELSYILGENNLATFFKYDSQGRLKEVFTETIDAPNYTGGFKRTKEYFYNYKNQP